MPVEQLSIQSKHDGLTMHASLYTSKIAQKGVVQVFHGMAEHRFRYDAFAKRLLKKGYIVLLCDHRGHGESYEFKGYFADHNGWQQNVEDLHVWTEMLKGVYPEMPLYLFGHSMGSLFARSFLKRYEEDVNGVILCGTPANNELAGIANKLAGMIGFFKGKRYPSKMLDNLSFGAFNKGVNNPKTKFDWLSINEENVKNYIEDENCGYLFTAQGFADLTDGIKDVYSVRGWNVKKPNLPIHFFSGAEDPCSNQKNGFMDAVNKMKLVGYKNVEYTLYPELRHEILNEDKGPEIMDDMIDFLNSIPR